MMDSTYGWNIISFDGVHCQVYGEIETVHVHNRATCIRPPSTYPPPGG